MNELNSISDRKQTCDQALKATLARAAHLAQSRAGLEKLYGCENASEKDLHAYRTIQAMLAKAIALLPDS